MSSRPTSVSAWSRFTTRADFPKLVLESKKDFATRYGLRGILAILDVRPVAEVLGYVKSNLKDLANHYHAQYQDVTKADEKPADFAEATNWYRGPPDRDHERRRKRRQQLSARHLLVSNRIAPRRGAGERAHRVRLSGAREGRGRRLYSHLRAPQRSEVMGEDQKVSAKRDTVTSSLRFAETFPQHEHAAVVLGAAAEDPVRDAGLPTPEGGHAAHRAFPNRSRAWFVEPGSSPRFDLDLAE